MSICPRCITRLSRDHPTECYQTHACTDEREFRTSRTEIRQNPRRTPKKNTRKYPPSSHPSS